MGSIPWTIIWKAGEHDLRVRQVVASPDLPKGMTHALWESDSCWNKHSRIQWVTDPEETLVVPAGNMLKVVAAIRGCHAKNIHLVMAPGRKN